MIGDQRHSELARRRTVDRVVVSLANARGHLPMDALLQMKLDGITFDHLASVYEEYTGKIAVENLRPSWLIFSEGFRKSRTMAMSKRTIDVVASAIGLTIGAPIMGAVAAAIALTSPGPVLFTQTRVGRNGRPFTLFKFRSMRQNAESGTGAVWARRNDTRVTPLGRFLRSTGLDELPQLWNVLAARPRQSPARASRIRGQPGQGDRSTDSGVVKPGLTGWAQVSRMARASKTRRRSYSATSSTSRTCRSGLTCSSHSRRFRPLSCRGT